ncbi:MAG: hypothetical protein QCH99_03685 [Candidatus Bathyarchaeota archaeon]|nr:hypothetical protein [Candidatus Bathyarchaeum tardum]
MEGEENAAEEFSELIVDETVDTVKWEIILGILALFGISTSSIIALLKSIFK